MTTIQACAKCRTVLLPGQQGCVRCGLPAAEQTQECSTCHHSTAVDARYCPACGQRLGQRSPVPAVDPATAPEPGTDPAAPLPSPTAFAKVRNPNRWVYRLTGLGLAVLLTGITGLYVVQSVFYTPERVVEEYFSALSERDFAAARSLLEEPSREDPNDPGELPLIPLNASYQPPSAAEVTSIQELNEIELAGAPAGADRADWRSASVSYRVGDRTYREMLYLHRQERKELGVLHGWQIYGGVNELTVPVWHDDARVLINGQAVPARDRYARARVFPGVHEVRLADDLLFEAEPVAMEVGLLEPREARLRPTVSESARSEVESQVKAYLDECAASTDPSPEGCPFSWVVFGPSQTVQWTIETYPELEFEMRGSELAVAGWSGRINVTYSRFDGSKDDFGTSFHVTGRAAVVDGKVTFRSD
ncbi:zinc ribbon domain-containing protein [Salinispora oceanensis]|uniref:zinc ribbon domain-containing protein n=1 Tax=Salinispora oceanensis TaxID=1050199 RepID=UPI0003AB2534|nr:zinc ribbon domain-containing protein [Salinispora oceanensis]